MLQCQITTGMAISVVDPLKVVNVDHQKDHGLADWPNPVHFALTGGEQRGTVQNAGQAVRGGQSAKVLLQIAAFGDLVFQIQASDLDFSRAFVGCLGQ